jgi:prophage antirepressor-like protein
VLPAIRKDGGYIKGEEKVASGEMSEEELLFPFRSTP